MINGEDLVVGRTYFLVSSHKTVSFRHIFEDGVAEIVYKGMEGPNRLRFGVQKNAGGISEILIFFSELFSLNENFIQARIQHCWEMSQLIRNKEDMGLREPLDKISDRRGYLKELEKELEELKENHPEEFL